MKVIQILNRFYVHDLDQAVTLYETLLNATCALRFKYAETGLELAQVGNLLILGGSEESLEPFKATKATFLVDSVEAFKAYMLENGSTVLSDIKTVPTGFNMTLQHADGTVVEYVEFKASPVELETSLKPSEGSITLHDLPYSEIAQIKELWEKNRLHHENTSEHFGHLYRGIGFESRMVGFEKYQGDTLKITVAKDRDTLVGYCLSTATESGGELASLHVDSRYRGRGIGKELSVAHLNWMRDKNCKIISVTVSQENASTIGFYKGLGFLPNTLEMLME